MSYDLNLYRKDSSKKPFDQEEVKNNLKGDFNYIHFHSDTGQAIDFEVRSETDSDNTEFHYQGEDNGYYWTYCSYGVDEKIFNNFKKVVGLVALKLNMQIEDPQTGEKVIDPETFLSDAEINKKFIDTKHFASKIAESLPYMLPATSKHFLLFFIVSEEPATHTRLLLTIGGDKLYASKVEAEQSVDQVVKRDIVELTGDSEYKILEMRKHDTAKDRFGNDLSRYAVYIKVPYFEPTSRNLSQRMVWKNPAASQS